MNFRDLKLRAARVVPPTPRRARAARRARVPHRARDEEADRRGPGPGGGAPEGAGALRIGDAGRRRMPRRARHRVHRQHDPRHPVRPAHLQAGAAGRIHDRRDRRDRPRRGGGALHHPEHVPVPRRSGPGRQRDVRRRAPAAGQRRPLAPDASAFRSAANGNAASSRTPMRRWPTSTCASTAG